MIDDVVNHVGRCHAALLLAHQAKGIGFEELQPVALPLAAIPALCRGQALSPCVRVQHLDRLSIGYGSASGLHADAGLSHGCPPQTAEDGLATLAVPSLVQLLEVLHTVCYSAMRDVR